MDQLSFDAQLKSSPLINDLVKRLIRYENNLAEIKRNLDEVNRKVDSLLDQSPASHAPEFNDPFAPGNIATLNGSRPSLALPPHQVQSNPVAPNQILAQNGSAPDEVGQISQRLNVLTSSVGQLLALQTQQIQATNASLPSASSLSAISPDVITTQQIGPSLSQHMLGNGLPSNRSPRHPPQPMRTWSAGSLDLPPRSSIDPSAAAATTRQENLLRDKRRSTVALLRRDSAGVCFHISRSSPT
jgi:translation initiation factor 4A